MLFPEYFDELGDEPFELYEKLEELILVDIAKKIKSNSNSIDLKTKNNIADYLNDIAENTANIVVKGGQDSYQNDKDIYKLGNKDLKPLSKNIVVLGLMLLEKDSTKEELKSKTLGLNDTPLESFYNRLTNINNDREVKKVINQLSDKGLQTISSLGNSSLEVEIRRKITGGINRLSAAISIQNANDMNQDLMELTAHMGARPSHAYWQGKIVSLSSRNGYLSLTDIGYGDITGFLGINCRHNWFPYFENVSTKAWTDDELKDIDPEPFYYGDKLYTIYEATQRQRYLERSIRKSKRKIILYKELESKHLTSERIKLQRYRSEYKRFSDKANLKMRYENLYVV